MRLKQAEVFLKKLMTACGGWLGQLRGSWIRQSDVVNPVLLPERGQQSCSHPVFYSMDRGELPDFPWRI
jgi:hypothetical protein